MRQRVSSSAMRVACCLIGLLPLALACDNATAPDVPRGAVSIAAPERFALWWRLTQACSGITGDYASVSWYVVPNTTTLTWQGLQVDAYWMSNPDRIVLSDAHRDDGPVVRHEMLHALLHRDGHPRDAFVTACGGVVACNVACSAEAGGYATPPASAPELVPSELTGRVDVFSTPTGTGPDAGAAALVTITNPRNEPVWVRLTPRESGDLLYYTFGIVVDYDDPTRIAALASETTTLARFPLGAGESRRWVWDGVLSGGRYGIVGYFNADSLPRQVITVGQ
jgi:hypothetical protein